ncbi:MAG: dTMP kinase [bacterium]
MADHERLSFKYEFEWQVNPYPGFFIVIEGLDGSGNSTQVDKLANQFFYDWEGITNKHIKVEKEPTYGPFGAPVNYALRRGFRVDDRTLQLGFTADRSDHIVAGDISKHLTTHGNILLMDRYVASTVAYGYARGLNPDWLIALQSTFFLPDLMFYLDASPAICMERMRKRNPMAADLYEKEETLQRAQEGYYYLIDEFPGLIQKIDGNDSIANVYNKITAIIEKHPKQYGGRAV